MDFRKKSFKEKFIDFFDTKGFYIIIAICLIIIGASIWTIITSDFSRLEIEEENKQNIETKIQKQVPPLKVENAQEKSSNATNNNITANNETLNQNQTSKSNLNTAKDTNNTQGQMTTENKASTSEQKSVQTSEQKNVQKKNISKNTNKSSSNKQTNNKQSNTDENLNEAKTNSETEQETVEVINPVDFKPIYPVSGNVLNEYSDENLIYSKTLDEWTFHSGIDIKANVGTTVKAAFDGTVIDVGTDGLLGNYVIIDHGDGYMTKYCNLLSLKDVSLGQLVKQGQKIGEVGQTASVESLDSPHLHFEVLYNGETQNPLKYLPKK